VATDALRIIGGRDMAGRLAACAAAVVANRTVFPFAAGDINLAVVEGSRHPDCSGMASITLFASHRNMIRYIDQAFRLISVMTA
jgi:hypothetical protein